MQQIYPGNQVKILDEAFLATSGLTSHELMENAAKEFVRWFLDQYFSQDTSVIIVVGAGNNGGDGYAIARLLSNHNFSVHLVEMFDSDDSLCPNGVLNKNLLPQDVKISHWKSFQFSDSELLIDSFLGVGLVGVLREETVEKINWINQFSGKIISVDIPSGLPSENGEFVQAVKATITVTFQFPKLSLFAPEYAQYSGDLVVVDIGMEDSIIKSEAFYIQLKDVIGLHKKFNRFSYKGDFGKVLIAGGSLGKMGALKLACGSALRSGSGLVYALVDEIGIPIIQTSLPEAMCLPHGNYDWNHFDAIALGPGWGILNRILVLKDILDKYNRPMVIDADGINLLSNHPDLIQHLPKNSILTPHIGEFQRLVGPSADYFERIELAGKFACDNGLILVLKGPNTLIALPDGRRLYNSSGTKFMATGGSGDVLTGMIASFLGMGYSPENAAICGVFQHGLAGEISGKKKGRSLIASDLIDAISETYSALSIS